MGTLYFLFRKMSRGDLVFSKELFGQRIKETRLARKETQPALAKALGVGVPHISEIESGHRTTTAEKIALICEHYKISSDYLLGLTDDPSPR